MKPFTATHGDLFSPSSAWMIDTLQDCFSPDRLHVLARELGGGDADDSREHFYHVRSQLGTTPKIRLQNGWTCMLRIKQMSRVEACVHSVHGYHLTLCLLHAVDPNGLVRGYCEFAHGEVR